MATKTFVNFDDLIAHIGNGIQDALEGDAQEIVKEKISKSARDRVILETAGRPADGIDDMSSMEGEVTIGKKVFKLKVKDVASPAESILGQPFDEAKNAAVGGTMFANWIEDGKWIDLKALAGTRRTMKNGAIIKHAVCRNLNGSINRDVKRDRLLSLYNRN